MLAQARHPIGGWRRVVVIHVSARIRVGRAIVASANYNQDHLDIRIYGTRPSRVDDARRSHPAPAAGRATRARRRAITV